MHGRLPGHVGYTLKGLSRHYAEVVLICDVELPSQDIEAVGSNVIRTVHNRERNPYVAWASFILGWDPHWAAGFDTLTLTHSDVFGPVSDPGVFLAEMESRKADYFGVTNRNLGAVWGIHNRRFGQLRSRLSGIKPVECYFISFKKPVFTSRAFRAVWSRVPGDTSFYFMEWLIARGLRMAGFKGEALLDVDSLTHAAWFVDRMDKLLDSPAPFLHIPNFKYCYQP